MLQPLAHGAVPVKFGPDHPGSLRPMPVTPLPAPTALQLPPVGGVCDPASSLLQSYSVVPLPQAVPVVSQMRMNKRMSPCKAAVFAPSVVKRSVNVVTFTLVEQE